MEEKERTSTLPIPTAKTNDPPEQAAEKTLPGTTRKPAAKIDVDAAIDSDIRPTN